jgi:uncharacterized membrane protein
MDSALDGKLNGIYGIMLVIWGSLFFLSWTKFDEVISILWDSNSGLSKKEDQRVHYAYFIYNWFTGVKEKNRRVPTIKEKCGRHLLRYLIIIIYCVFLLTYKFTKDDLKEQAATESNDEKVNSQIFIISNVITVLYTLLIILIGFINTKLLKRIAEFENFQCWADYDNFLITRLFSFSIFNFYSPIFLLIFLDQDYKGVFQIMITNMVCK